MILFAMAAMGLGTAHAHQMLYDQDGIRLAVELEAGLGAFLVGNADTGAGKFSIVPSPPILAISALDRDQPAISEIEIAAIAIRVRQAVCVTRTAEGRNRAKRRGQHMGRPSRLTDAQKAEARRRRAKGATLNELARSYDVSRSITTGQEG